MVWILIVHDSSTDSLDRWLSRQILWIRCQLIAERGLWNQWKSVDVCLPGCDCFGGNPKQEVDFPISRVAPWPPQVSFGGSMG
jgi:hypothetical protein